MKIDEFTASILPVSKVQQQKSQKIQGLDFQQVLINASKRLQDTCAADWQGAAPLRSQSLKAIEDAIAHLERYHEGLSSIETSLKKIDPIVQRLTMEVDELNSLSQKLPPDDPLRKILDETAILSAVEIEKFRRGDYI